MSSFYDEWNREKNSNAGRSVVAMAREMIDPTSGLLSSFDEERFARVRDSYAELPGCVEEKPGFVLHDVLSKEECQTLIRAIPTQGTGYFSPADIAKRYRDRIVHRYLSWDAELSDLIFDRIKSFLPEILDGGEFVSISPEWRFLHYELGGFQGAHLDFREKRISNTVKGSEIPLEVESRLTIQMYLNDHDVDFTGGELTFEKTQGSVTSKFPFRPRAGDCVVFFQEDHREDFESFIYFHTAEEVKSGHKYAMRSMGEYIWRATAAPPAMVAPLHAADDKLGARKAGGP